VIQKKHYLFILFLLIFTLFNVVPLFGFDFYWENTEQLSSSESRFPQSSSGKDLNIVVWEDVEITGKDTGNIWLSAQIANNSENTWKTVKHFAGPYVYSGNVPNIFSVAINKENIIAIAVQSGSQQISSIVSKDGGDSFKSYDIYKTGESLIAPRIYQSSGNTFTVFATGVDGSSFNLKIARSTDGITWTPFSAFASTSSFTNAFLPTLQVVADSSGGTSVQSDVVVFQAFYRLGTKLSYQLFSTISKDKGLTWSEPALISQMAESNQTFDKFHNQRPNLLYIDNTLYLTWERSYYTSTDTAIYVVSLTSSGAFATTPTKISPANVEAHQPTLFMFHNKPALLWFDNRRGNDCVYFAQKTGYLWEDEQISSSSQTAVFACPLVINYGQDFHVFWEQQLNNTNHRVVRLSQDRSVLSATLAPESFVDGKRNTSSKATFSITLPQDSSGIAGYSWIFTDDENQQPPKTFMEFPKKKQISGSAIKDGKWFFKVRVQDMAGNWSDSTSITYYRDTTPPEKPQILLPKMDDNGYLDSNTFLVNWEPPAFNSDDDGIGGYTYSLDYLAPLSSYIREPEKWNSEGLAILNGSVPSRILTQNTNNTWYNRDNGVYLFTVAAIDTVGNIGKGTSIPIYLNKYIPYTVIWSIDDKTNEFGDISLSIYGKGYTYDGVISEIYIDQDGQAPWDRVLKLKDTDYTIYSDNSISGIKLVDLPEGSYKIGLVHTKRGLYVSDPILSVSEFGTVKVGNFTYRYKPVWKVISDHYKYSINAGDVLLWCLLMLAIIGILASLHGLVSTAKEVSMVNFEVKALIQGESMPLEKQKQQQQLKKLHKRGISLKYKLILVTSALSLSIILLVSIPLGVYMVDTQQDTLSKGLQDRTAVLLDSLSSGVKAYMPSKDVLEMSFLPKQADSMDDTNYVTILGLATNNSDTDLNHVWASNDPDITVKIDDTDLLLGQSRLIGDDIAKIAESCKSLNTKAVTQVQDIANQISQLTKEGIALVSKTDSASIERRSEIQNLINQLKEKLSIDLNEISVEGTGIIPSFDAKKIDRKNTTYIAYKPVLFRQGAEQMFVRGIVLVEFTTKNLIVALDVARQTIINTAIIIGVIAIIIGIIASLFLARIIISPIRRVVESVSIISNTVNKKALGRNPLKITRGDEIGELAESVNRMTNDIQFDAWHKSFLNDGLEVQRAMLPLDVQNGKKQSIGHYEQNNLDIFAFFKGAVTVSGDYFDYRKLDERYYLLLKADASGHDEGASLVVTDFSAIYIDSFRDWNIKKGTSYLSKVVEKINAHLNARNYPGKFVAFTLVLYDSENGDMYCCNAGDNIMHIYDASEKKNNKIILTETPAAGAIDPYLIEMKGGYPVEKLHLDPGDILFLYSDGIEEEQHKYKDELGNHVAFKANEKGQGTTVCVPPPEPGEPTGDIEFEEMSTDVDRVNPIIDAVMTKGSYTLHRRKNPLEFEPTGYDFDFTKCKGTPEEAVMALLAVDFIFRMEKPIGVNEYNTVEQDKKIDQFLSEHFLQYQKYLAKGIEHFDEKLQSEYMLYTELKVDEQFDDLTILTLQRK
jgi:HAMP domain-containing protein